MGYVDVLVEMENDRGSGRFRGEINKDFSGESEGLEIGLDG